MNAPAPHVIIKPRAWQSQQSLPHINTSAQLRTEHNLATCSLLPSLAEGVGHNIKFIVAFRAIITSQRLRRFLRPPPLFFKPFLLQPTFFTTQQRTPCSKRSQMYVLKIILEASKCLTLLTSSRSSRFRRSSRATAAEQQIRSLPTLALRCL